MKLQRKPKLGQNFLISPTAPGAIVRALGDISEATVVEIGPGHGAITDLLAQSAGRLIAVEYDRLLAAKLALRFAAAPKVEIISADILAVDLQAMAARAGRKLLIAGNLPYGITSDILLHLFAHHTAIERAVLMVQREVADRVTAAPGTREYGLLTATTQLYGNAEPLFTLSPSDFSPPPEVRSTVFRLQMAPRFADLGVEPAAFIPFLRQCFAQKRKTLVNNLRNTGYPGESIQHAFAACGVDAQVRAEALLLTAMACIYRQLKDWSR